MSVYRFGPFEARTQTEELYKFGTRVALRGQPFQILRALLSRRGEIVTREEMRDQLWAADTFVDFEHGINASLRKLRVALGDSAVKPLYVETLPGQGYRFIAPFDVIEDDPAQANAEQPVAETQQTNPEDIGAGSTAAAAAWRRGVLLGLVVGAVAFVLLLAVQFFFATPGIHRVVDAAGREGHESPAPPTTDSDTSLHGITTPNDKNFSFRVHATPSLSPITGKVWLVSVAQASHVTFPPPNGPPDATFIARGIAFLGSSPKNCYTVATFLTGCGMGAFNLKFSGLPNASLGGAPVGPDTAMSGDTWGVLIEFNGTANLAHGQEIAILHDDGVALEIDGTLIPGFSSGPTTPQFDSSTFAGSTGVHSYDLLYANAAGGGAWILFYPALF